MSSRVCVIGSINADLVVVADRLPAPGETVLGGHFSTHPGGKGANAAVAAARAGAEVVMIGGVGSDDHGRAALDALRADGIDVDRVRVHDTEPTGVALIAVGARGENQIVVAPGANASWALDEADRDVIAGSAVIVTNHEVPQPIVTGALQAAHEAGVAAILNPAPARALSADVLRLGPILTPNEHELVVGIGNDVTEVALEELVARHAGPVIVTQGAAGALLAHGSQRERFAGHPVATSRDTTGAGDTFNGVLAAWLAGGASLPDAIRAANAAAALSIASLGAREGMPSEMAIQELLGAP